MIPSVDSMEVSTQRCPDWLRAVYEYIALYGGLLLFALVCLSWSVPAALLYPVLPRRLAAPLGRRAIMTGFRGYLFVLRLCGIVKCDLSALDALRDERNLMIAPNHPALIDVVLLASRLPRASCIMKADLWDNVLLGGGARLARYIRNDSSVNMVRLAADDLRGGGQLLVFPEGTRTTRKPVNEFKGGFALVAKKAGCAIQTVFIETSSPFLSKDRPLLRRTRFPVVYRVRLGRRFNPPQNVRPFVAELERYFHQELASHEARGGSREQ